MKSSFLTRAVTLNPERGSLIVIGILVAASSGVPTRCAAQVSVTILPSVISLVRSRRTLSPQQFPDPVIRASRGR